MQTSSQADSTIAPRKTGRVAIGAILLLALAAGGWFWREQSDTPQVRKGPGVVPVVSAEVVAVDVPVRLSSNGTVSALQSVDIRAQISATIKAVHVREGQFVRRGERLFSLDTRTEEANLGKTEAQLARSRADLANAERNLRRQRELFNQKFISQTALDAVQNQVDSLSAQVAADRAVVESSRVARGYGEIVAPIAGRIGSVAVYPGSLVQPSGPLLVGITQIDPINVSFTLPERELPGLQQSMANGEVAVTAQLDDAGQQSRRGRLIFIDNSVDSGSGTIRLKANFANTDSRLWPGMFVNLTLSPRTLKNALTVPVQAVQTGPEKKFLYVIDAEGKVSPITVRVLLIQDGRAVIEGADAGTKVVVEGAQNLRPGSNVTEAKVKP
ncbi:MAG: efflux RND transporter periplasmic adaptor subunit [Rhodocyclaceae bacterium]|nr:efflux RND transporter periplasmic adaptor subunit [Rhodocyclaceae bacterium]